MCSTIELSRFSVNFICSSGWGVAHATVRPVVRVSCWGFCFQCSWHMPPSQLAAASLFPPQLLRKPPPPPSPLPTKIEFSSTSSPHCPHRQVVLLCLSNRLDFFPLPVWGSADVPGQPGSQSWLWPRGLSHSGGGGGGCEGFRVEEAGDDFHLLSYSTPEGWRCAVEVHRYLVGFACSARMCIFLFVPTLHLVCSFLSAFHLRGFPGTGLRYHSIFVCLLWRAGGLQATPRMVLGRLLLTGSLTQHQVVRAPLFSSNPNLNKPSWLLIVFLPHPLNPGFQAYLCCTLIDPVSFAPAG